MGYWFALSESDQIRAALKKGLGSNRPVLPGIRSDSHMTNHLDPDQL